MRHAVRGDEVQDEDRPERETHHATGGEETDAEGCIRRLCASDRRPDGVESRGPEPADHEQDEDEPEFGSNTDQAQERRRHQDADTSDHTQPDVLAKRTEDRLRHGRGDPEHRDHHGEGRGTRIEPHLKSREHRTQDRGDRIVDRVDERHEDCERRPAEESGLADDVRHPGS